MIMVFFHLFFNPVRNVLVLVLRAFIRTFPLLLGLWAVLLMSNTFSWSLRMFVFSQPSLFWAASFLVVSVLLHIFTHQTTFSCFFFYWAFMTFSNTSLLLSVFRLFPFLISLLVAIFLHLFTLLPVCLLLLSVCLYKKKSRCESAAEPI